MGLFTRRRDDTSERKFRELEDKITGLRRDLPVPFEAPPVAPPRLLDADETEAAITDLRVHLGRISEQLAALDRRITSVSSELANQLDELGSEMATLSARADAEAAANEQPSPDPTPAIDEQVFEQIREAQERLAGEQARYQIAFREDLARLADQVRR